MDSAKPELQEQILLKTLPHVVWKLVFQNLLFDFKTLDSCSQASSFLENLIKRNGHVAIVSGDASGSFGCVPKSVRLTLKTVLPKPQLTALSVRMCRTFRPRNDYLEWLIESQRDSLEILHVSCVRLQDKPFGLVLAGMTKLRKLRLKRSARWDDEGKFHPSITIPEYPFLPALESLTLSSVGGCDHWVDLLNKQVEHPHPEYSTCEMVKHLCLHPSSPKHLRWTTREIAEKYVLPNLISLEIPAMLLDYISKIFPDPGNLKRLTLTLPRLGLNKHLFDECITGYGDNVCAAILANPDQDPQQIYTEMRRRLDDFNPWEQNRIRRAENVLRRTGLRFPNITHFTGLEELSLKSDTGSWGPTVVSCTDLLSMKSLKILRFCGFYPEYIPEEMMAKLNERFTVIITSNSDISIDSSTKINSFVHQNLLDVLPEAVWKQVFCHLSSSFSFQTLESCSEASNVFDDLIGKAGMLSSRPAKIVPSNFDNRISLHRRLTPIPRITTMNVCVNSNFHPMAYYLNCLLKSQRNSLEILRISCLGTKGKPLNIDLPEMKKLRNLNLERDVIKWTRAIDKSLHFRETAFLPALESLTLSAFGPCESWVDFLEKPEGSEDSEYQICEAVKHLRVLPGRPMHAHLMMGNLSENFVFRHLVSLEMPAVLLDRQIPDLFPAPDTLKRLTLTLPTEGFHKHLFDVAITGYGDELCAAILANPDRDPQDIRAEIEEENERQVRQLGGERGDMEYDWKLRRVEWDNRLRREGRRWPNITGFLGLKELTLKSDTGDWGPTIVSHADLLNMKSLKSLRFSGFYPKYIPDDMMDDLKARFTVAWG